MPQRTRKQKELAEKHRKHLIENIGDESMAPRYSLPKVSERQSNDVPELQTQTRQKVSSVTAQNALDSTFVIKDLQRIGVLTVALLVIEFALYFILT